MTVDAAGRPYATVLFRTWEQERYVRDAVRAILAQKCPPLEIILSDDASTDRSFAILAEEAAAYRGPHRLRLNRNPHRLGPLHVPLLVDMAEGGILVNAHGDDIATPRRVRRLVEVLAATGAALVSSDAELIDAEGTSLGLLEGSGRSRRIGALDIMRSGWRRTMLGSGMAFRREVYAAFRRRTREAPPVFDLILPFRAALLSQMVFVGEPLLRYRRHDANMGNFVVDFTSSDLSFAETLSAHELTAYCWMLEDLRVWAGEGITAPRLHEIETALHGAILERIKRMSKQRLLLAQASYAPGWITHDAMRHRAIRDELRMQAVSGPDRANLRNSA